MNLRVLPPTLHELDRLTHDTLVVSHFVEDRPLRGLAGLVDWRMNGTLNRYVVQGRATGRFLELVMMPGHHRLAYERIIMVGLGTRREFTPELYRQVSNQILTTLARLGTASFTMGLPGLDALRIPPRQAAHLWVGLFHEAYGSKGAPQQAYDIAFIVPEALQPDVRDPIDTYVRQHRRH